MFFNHVRFGTYFADSVIAAAKANNFSPLVLFSVIRQESMFQPYIGSSAGALGLMQLIPDTGKQTASGLGWPQNFITNDLYNANVSITLGTRYLANQRDYLGGDLYDALAAYNAGPGNAQTWQSLSNGDPDLFLEEVRYDETRTYIEQIVEFMNIYRVIYEK
jgi:soluble lytic murein transglycosylase